MDTRAEYQRRINLALQYIEVSYAENIRLEDIAAAAQFSMYHFHRLFTSLVGETPMDYLRRIRLEKSAALLYLEPDQAITKIALDTGFSSPAVFARAFQNRFGLSASEFRKKIVPEKFHLPIPAAAPPESKSSPVNLEPLEVRQMSAVRLAYARSMKGYGTGIDAAWKRIFSWAYPRGYMRPTTRIFGIPLDDPEITPAGHCRYFAAITIPPEAHPDGSVELWVLDAGWYAVFPFRGTLSDFSPFYKRVYGDWLPASGYLPDDRPALEEYPLSASQPSSKTPLTDRIFEFSLLLPVRPL